jgi:cation:H+ antiporter
MNDIFAQGIIYLLSFIVVWIGSGLVVSSVSRLARSWNLPVFTLSFFLLGLLTSLPEIAVGSQAVLNNDPTIFVGNLLGGIFVLFLLIIPILGLLGNGVKMPSQLGTTNILLILIVVLAPSLLSADRVLTDIEGISLLLLYGALFIVLFRQQSLLQRFKKSFGENKKHGAIDLVKIVIGVGLVFGASHQIIESTLYFSDILKVSPFLVSLIVVSFGTNIPEFSIIFRSILQKKKDIALADYLGSAAMNTPLLGILILLSKEPITLPNHFLTRFLLLTFGLILFFLFSRSGKKLSKKESLGLLLCYVLFVFLEIYTASTD